MQPDASTSDAGGALADARDRARRRGSPRGVTRLARTVALTARSSIAVARLGLGLRLPTLVTLEPEHTERTSLLGAALFHLDDAPTPDSAWLRVERVVEQRHPPLGTHTHTRVTLHLPSSADGPVLVRTPDQLAEALSDELAARR